MKPSIMKSTLGASLLTMALLSNGYAQDNAANNDWQFSVGAGVVYAPAFLGADSYQLSAAPGFFIQYQDWLTLSPVDGISASVFNRSGVTAKLNVGYDGGRKEDNDNTFRVGGNRSQALRGLGDVDSSMTAGASVAYALGNSLSVGMAIDKTLSSHKGMTMDISANHSSKIGQYLLSVGPYMTWADSDYTGAYFGVTDQQSAKSGLHTYNAGSGLLSYGVNSSLYIPVTKAINASVFFKYSRLTGDAADSPLVVERGNRNQFYTGAYIGYSF